MSALHEWTRTCYLAAKWGSAERFPAEQAGRSLSCVKGALEIWHAPSFTLAAEFACISFWVPGWHALALTQSLACGLCAEAPGCTDLFLTGKLMSRQYFRSTFFRHMFSYMLIQDSFKMFWFPFLFSAISKYEHNSSICFGLL